MIGGSLTTADYGGKFISKTRCNAENRVYKSWHLNFINKEDVINMIVN